MEQAQFKKSAMFIVQRNVSARVTQAHASLELENSKLKLVYCVDGEPNDDDWEDCELACAELIAEFPEIVHAETNCYSVDQCPGDTNSLVFVKG